MRQQTLLFLGQNHRPVAPVVTWLSNQGGYCDCELLNAEDKFLSASPESKL